MRCKNHTARTFDAVKITVLSACAAMADRIIRIWPMDDRWDIVLLTRSGSKFGKCIGNSSCLKQKMGSYGLGFGKLSEAIDFRSVDSMVAVFQ